MTDNPQNAPAMPVLDAHAPPPTVSDCPARKTLDDGLSEILNLPDLAVLGTLLASEPVVSNRRL